MGRDATKQANQIRGGRGVGGDPLDKKLSGKISLEPSGPMNVAISLDAGAQAALSALGVEEIKKAMSKIGDAIYEKTNSSIDIRGMMG